MKQIIFLLLLTLTFAVECSTVEQLEVPSTNVFTTSKQIAFPNGESTSLSLDICVKNATKPIHVSVYDNCKENEFADLLMSFDTQATCDESIPLDILPEKNHLFYLDIVVSEIVEYQISISPIKDDNNDNEETDPMKEYGKYIIVAVCLVCVGFVAIILAIVASRKHKKDEESKYQPVDE